MASKTTVAIDDTTRKRIKKLAAWLDITQGDVINNAIDAYEKIVLQAPLDEVQKDLSESLDAKIKRIFEQATERVWKADPEAREVQQRLMAGPDTIDDYIIKEWRSGLNE
ncbi:MAG: hypothetical protein JW839_04365 [Candidatus Lokiarchaeota archaeon]|nr:hypothetical protein [Candidatus Lokiarchaeota archaeon]